MFEQVGVVYLVDVQEVFPGIVNLIENDNEKYHAMLDDLEDSLLSMEKAKETESLIGVFGTIVVTMEGNESETKPIIEATCKRIAEKWATTS